MPSITARTKYSQFQGKTDYIKVGVTILIGSGLSLLSYYTFQNLIALFTLIFCSILIIFIIMSPAQKIEIAIDGPGLRFDDDLLNWDQCHSWVMVDLEDTLEFMVQTVNFDTSFYYFYVDEEQEELQDFITTLAQILPYNEQIEDKNVFHKIVRFLGLG